MISDSKKYKRSNKQSVIEQYPVFNRALADLPGESWEDIPGFEGEYQVSSLGRVKSLRRWRACGNKGGGYYTRENIRNQIIRFTKNKLINQNNYTIGIALKKNGKAFTRNTARYVYSVFVEPFDLEDKNILVSFKDNDGRNLHYKNLFCTNRSGLLKRSFQQKRHRSIWQKNRVAVRQVTMDGKVIATYPSMSKASEKTGISLSGIALCMKGQIHQFNGYRWEAVEKKYAPPVSEKAPGPVFNEYLWKKLGKPKSSKANPIASLNLGEEDMNGECWKPIEGLEDAYMVSNFGRIKGLPRFKNGRLHVWTKGMIKRLIADASGQQETKCLLVQLARNGKKFQQSVARLVYHHFVNKINLSDKSIRIVYKNNCCYDLDCKNLYIRS